METISRRNRVFRLDVHREQVLSECMRAGHKLTAEYFPDRLATVLTHGESRWTVLGVDCQVDPHGDAVVDWILDLHEASWQR